MRDFDAVIVGSMNNRRSNIRVARGTESLISRKEKKINFTFYHDDAVQ